MASMFGSPRLLVAAWAAALGFAFVSGQAAAARSCPNAGYVVVERNASPETRPLKDWQGHPIFVRRTAITTTADLTEIKLAGDAYDTQIQMKFTPAAARRLHDATTNKPGLRIAFVSDDQAVSVVTWTGPYGMDADLGVQISLGRSASEVRPLVAAIQRCVGPNPR